MSRRVTLLKGHLPPIRIIDIWSPDADGTLQCEDEQRLSRVTIECGQSVSHNPV